MQPMEATGKAACRRSTAVRIDNDGYEEAENENKEQEEEEEEKKMMTSSLKNSASIKLTVLDDVCVNMAGADEITQNQEQVIAIESSSSQSLTVESKQFLPSSSSQSSSSSAPPPPPPLKPASGWRSSEGGREGPPTHHRVTFAEPCNKYVHSDSGIVLSPDDTPDNGDVTGGGGGGGPGCESDDDESDDVDDADDVRGRRHPRLTPVNANAVPGPPIIKLHRCRSTESHDNPFLFDGELSRKADYIITHSTFLRTCVRVADPDQISLETETINPGPDYAPPAENSSHRNSATPAPDLPAAEPSEGARSVSPGCPSATPQRSAVKDEPLPRQKGDTERPLLSPRKKKKEGNGLGGLKNNRQSKSKRAEICCVLQ